MTYFLGLLFCHRSFSYAALFPLNSLLVHICQPSSLQCLNLYAPRGFCIGLFTNVIIIITTIGFHGQLRQISSQFHFLCVQINAVLPLQLLLRFKFRIGLFNFVLSRVKSLSTLFNLAHCHSFSWHTHLKKRLRIWMLLLWIVESNDYFFKSNDATLHLTDHKTKLNDPFSVAFRFCAK